MLCILTKSIENLLKPIEKHRKNLLQPYSHPIETRLQTLNLKQSRLKPVENPIKPIKPLLNPMKPSGNPMKSSWPAEGRKRKG